MNSRNFYVLYKDKMIQKITYLGGRKLIPSAYVTIKLALT